MTNRVRPREAAHWAYDAYADTRHWRADSGAELPQWSEQTDEIRELWRTTVASTLGE